jgi:hypothetical protein
LFVFSNYSLRSSFRGVVAFFTETKENLIAVTSSLLYAAKSSYPTLMVTPCCMAACKSIQRSRNAGTPVTALVRFRVFSFSFAVENCRVLSFSFAVENYRHA